MKVFSLLKTVLTVLVVLVAALDLTCASLHVTVGNMDLSTFLDEYRDNIECSIKLRRKPLKVYGVSLPQIRCVSCGKSCGGGMGRCAELIETIGKKRWSRGCVCKMNKYEPHVIPFGEVNN